MAQPMGYENQNNQNTSTRRSSSRKYQGKEKEAAEV